jgi:hypothetical protein
MNSATSLSETLSESSTGQISSLRATIARSSASAKFGATAEGVILSGWVSSTASIAGVIKARPGVRAPGRSAYLAVNITNVNPTKDAAKLVRRC